MAVLVSLLLWLSVKLDGRYQQEVDVPVRYLNMPSQLKLLSDLPPAFHVRVEGEGHQLLAPRVSLHSDSLEVDLGSYLQRGYLPTRALLASITDYLPSGVQVLGVAPDTLRLSFEEKVSKRVPIVSQLELAFLEGYRLVEEPKFKPDSVTLVGTKQELDSITSWPTQAGRVGGLEGNHRGSVALEKSNQLLVRPAEVQYELIIDQYSEGRMVVPLEIVGGTSEDRVRLLPAQVQVIYLCPLRNFKQVDASSFRVVVDLSTLADSAQLAFPFVEKQPSYLRAVSIQPQAVEVIRRNP